LTSTLNDSSHLGWPIPVLTPVLELMLDGPIALRPTAGKREAHAASRRG
jgi:hypothetical protein